MFKYIYILIQHLQCSSQNLNAKHAAFHFASRVDSGTSSASLYRRSTPQMMHDCPRLAPKVTSVVIVLDVGPFCYLPWSDDLIFSQ